MKPLRFFVSITLTIGLSYGVIQAWTGLTASEGDTLDYTIWNELVDKVSLITSTGGNVGIGTDSPSNNLDVNGNVSIGDDTAGYVNIKGGSTTSAQLIFYDQGTQRARIGVPTGETYLSLRAGSALTPGHIVINSTGNVGIGTPTTAEKLTVNGYVQAVGYYYSSDRVLKENISSLTDALDMVENLRGVQFNWKETGDMDIGFIAQEVEEVVPELVSHKGEYRSVKYGNITAILVEALKEQQLQIDTQQQLLQDYETRIDTLENTIQGLLTQ